MANLPLRTRRLLAAGLNRRDIAAFAGRRMLRAATGPNAVAASLTIGAGNAAVTYTAPLWRGASGNAARISHVVPAGANVPLSIVRTNRDYVVTLATGASAGVATSTAAQVAAAWNASVDVVDRGIIASLPGTGASVATAQALTNLTGGLGGS
jgi:hypothetical protein